MCYPYILLLVPWWALLIKSFVSSVCVLPNKGLFSPAYTPLRELIFVALVSLDFGTPKVELVILALLYLGFKWSR